MNAPARPPLRPRSPVLEALARVDWPRAIHRGAGFIRAMRGDQDVIEDATAEVERSKNTHKLIDRLARAAVGCNESADCPCPICKERRGERP